VPHMATMTAAQICNPIALLIAVKTRYSLVHVMAPTPTSSADTVTLLNPVKPIKCRLLGHLGNALHGTGPGVLLKHSFK
jgi:hypothetical protein